jgi:glycerol kinase
VRDAVTAMGRAAGTPVTALRVDGGAAAMDLLLQIQADQLQVPVSRPRNLETTALGAAYLAGLTAGVWGSLDDLRHQWQLDVAMEPAIDRATADAAHATWLRAVDRSRAWATP